jgi:hypothetical protein
MALSKKTMWYPTKIQWLVIWVTTVLCLLGFLSTDPQPEAFVMPGALVCALFVWQASADFRRTRD